MSDGAVRYLPPLVGFDEGTRGTVTNHRMREVTEQVAQRGIWNSGLLTEVRDLFDSLAPGWTATRDHPARNAPLLDALDRGGVEGRTVVELGAGTCISSRALVGRFDCYLAADLSPVMLAHAVDGAPPLLCVDA